MLASSPFTNQQLLYRSLLAGEDAAFEYLYRLLYQRISGHIFATGGSSADTKVVVHESIITLLFNLRHEKYQWRAEVELITYMVSIARHKWSEMIRSQSRSLSLDQITLPPDSEVAALPEVDELDFENRRQLVEQNITLLGEKCRRCIDLFYFQQQSMQKIAVQLGWASDDVAKKEKYRCLKKLRQLIGLPAWK